MKMLTCIHGKRLMKITDRQWIWYCIVGYIGNINILFSLGHLLNYCVIPVQERWGITSIPDFNCPNLSLQKMRAVLCYLLSEVIRSEDRK
ncbi:uncharacterized protein [Magallana gigas]|uniref:uncharacterized protein isoform X1 n=1 Tax=Magallana gigas TaxID=29159 RepID=UPI00333ED4BA